MGLHDYPQSADPGIRRVCMAVEARSPAQVPRQLLHAVYKEIRLERVWWQDSAPGYGIGILPPGIDEPWVIRGFIRRLSRKVTEFNTPHPTSDRLLIRLAVGEGLTYLSDAGFDGPAVESAERILTALRDSGRQVGRAAEMIVVFTEQLAEELSGGRPVVLDGAKRFLFQVALGPHGRPVRLCAEYYPQTPLSVGSTIAPGPESP